MADSTRLVSETITVTLTVTEDVDGVETNVDADETPTAEICLHSQVVETIAAADVSNPSTGVYTFSWSPDSVGIHVVTWSWTYATEEYESEFKINVQADPAGTVTDDSSEEEDSDPDIGASNVCTVTHTFYDASGNALEGIYVRFTPLRSTDSFLSSGAIVMEVDTSSDEDGAISFNLVRGVTGMLAISGLGIVRKVKVPDVAAITLEGLVDQSEGDLLEVQTPQFTSLPRRS